MSIYVLVKISLVLKGNMLQIHAYIRTNRSLSIITILVVLFSLVSSKAFDRVNHWTLFKKLLLKGVSTILIRILCFWYRSQQLFIKWGITKSLFFTITNGVRQGGILSPNLFSIYMDDFSKMLNDSGIGCCVDHVCVNHVF